MLGAAATALTVSTVVAPSIAAPSDNAGCTGKTASGAAKAAQPFGKRVVGPTASDAGQDPDANFGQDVIRPEATAPHDTCS